MFRGGLEAPEGYLSGVLGVLKDCGMALAVVQHRDPTHASGLPELLQRCTPLRVVEVRDRMPLEADVICVIPPDKDLSLLRGRLYLLAPVAPRGLRMAVDFFFRSLAADQRERAIGVVLSGMGSDGLLGQRAIKEVSGLTRAQNPDTALAASMPKSAIDARVVDIVGLSTELPARIADYAKRAPGIMSDVAATITGGESALEKIVILLRDRCGNDLSLYKPSTFYRRIERRVALHHLSGISSYVSYLRENPQELDILFKELRIGVTNFFRDPAVWETLKSKVIPELLAASPAGRTFRAWVPACSSGEDAYTLAMVFRDALEAVGLKSRFPLQIYAADLDADAIEKARKGVDPKNIAADITPACLDRHFVAEGDIVHISGRTGKYLEPAAGKVNVNIYAMAREALHVTREESQTAIEELRSANEELQAKVSDLTCERNDMTNLLSSTQIATVFLNGSRKLRRFTALTTKLFKRIPADIGRPLSDLVSDLDYPKLLADAQEVLRTLVLSEKQVSTHDGRWFRVRIMPYRTQDNVIDGVVMTFADTTEIKKLEAELRTKGA